jgi:hypothetical protein
MGHGSTIFGFPSISISSCWALLMKRHPVHFGACHCFWLTSSILWMTCGQGNNAIASAWLDCQQQWAGILCCSWEVGIDWTWGHASRWWCLAPPPLLPQMVALHLMFYVLSFLVVAIETQVFFSNKLLFVGGILKNVLWAKEVCLNCLKGHDKCSIGYWHIGMWMEGISFSRVCLVSKSKCNSSHCSPSECLFVLFFKVIIPEFFTVGDVVRCTWIEKWLLGVARDL